MSGKGNLPERLGKYEIRGTLGRGAMGLVYDGWDPVIGRQVAIKTVRLAGADDEEAVESVARFKREAQAAGRLTHPNIVGVFDYGETDDIAYIVMEFVGGGSLKEVLDRKEALSVRRVCEIMGQVLSALAFSHGRGVVHRDIKPANIMLTTEGSVKLADFGIARIESSSMTSVGVIMGTPAYMAPEQFLGEPADARSDLYAAGATFFHLLTGTRPYEGNPTSIMQKVLNAELPPAPSERVAGIPPGLDAVIRRAMARQREDRFQDALEFARAMLVALTAPPPPPPETRPAEDDSDGTLVMGAGGLTPPPPAEPPAPPPPSLAPSPASAQAVAKPSAPKTAAAAATKPPVEKSGGNMGLFAAIGAVVVLGGGAAAYFLTRPATPVQTASTAQTPAPMPVPAVVKTPVLPPPPDPAQTALAVTQALAHSPCVLARAQARDGAILVTGTAGAGDTENNARDVARHAAAGLPMTWSVRDFNAPFCPALEAIRPAYNAGTLSLSLQDGITTAREGSHLLPAVRDIGFDAYVRVDSLDSSGANFHIYPTAKDSGTIADPSTLLSTGDALTLGGPGRNVIEVAPLLGDNLLFAVASSEKLLAPPRKNDEPLTKYLADLSAAIAQAQAHGAKLAANLLIVELEPK